MSGADLATTLTAAVALGAVTALLGAAVAVVGLATRTLHLAVGEVLVVGVLLELVLAVDTVTGIPTGVAVLAAVALGAALSAALGPLVIDRLDDGLPRLVGLAVAAGVIQAAASRWLGTRTLRPEAILALPDVTIAGVGIDGPVLLAIVVGLPGALALAAVVRSTRWGRRVRIVGSSPRAAALGGTSPVRTRAGALALGGAVAVVAGLLVAPITFVGVGQGAAFTVRGVAAATLLGRGGPAAAIPAGLLLGVAEAFGQQIWPAAGAEVALAIVIVAVLVGRGSEHRRAWGRAW